MSHLTRVWSTIVVVGLVAVAVGLGLSRGQLIAADSPYQFVRGWPQPLPEGQKWGEVTGVALGTKGQIFAVRRDEHPAVVELDSVSGKVLKMWGDFVVPHHVKVDRNGSLWIIDTHAKDGKGSQVFKFTQEGRLLLTLGTKGVEGEGPNTFDGSADVTVAANGDIFIADGHRNNRVVKFSKDGKYIKAWGKKGQGPGEFNLPHAVAIDSRGRVFVADRDNRRIQVFDQDGTFLLQWTQFGQPSGIFITADDTMYVAQEGQPNGGVYVGNAKDGSLHYKIEGTLPQWLAVDEHDGTLYTAEATKGPDKTLHCNCVKKFVKNAKH